jgi:hypothetical protein
MHANINDKDKESKHIVPKLIGKISITFYLELTLPERVKSSCARKLWLEIKIVAKFTDFSYYTQIVYSCTMC